MEEGGGRQFVTADGLWRDGDGFDVGVGAAAEGDGLVLGCEIARRGSGNAALRRCGFKGARGAGGGEVWKIGKVEACGLTERGRGGGQGLGEGRRGGSSGGERSCRRRVDDLSLIHI